METKKSNLLKDEKGRFKKGNPGVWKGKKRGPTPLHVRKKLSDALKGEKSHLWRGGKTEESKVIRTRMEYRLWRNAVFLRDKYMCIWCGKGNKNGERTPLEADHIKPFSLFPELRFAIDNGRTLCKPCHTKTDTYARKCPRKR